ncbi:MAG: hypothetical protein AAGA32_12215 [Pseudomonadota bacterium]
MRKSFVMVAAKRSGTTALRDALNACPEIEMYGEAYFPSLFEWGFYQHYAQAVQANPGAILPAGRSKVYRAHFASLRDAHPDSVVGIDVKYSDVGSNPDLLRALSQTVDVAIHLRRENVLRSIVSHRIMEARLRNKLITEDKIHSSEVSPPIQVTLDPDDLMDGIRGRTQQMERFRRDISQRFQFVVEISYEGLFVEADAVTIVAEQQKHDILGALGVTWNGDLVSALKKQTSRDLRDVIANYDAVAKRLDGSTFASMLTND